MSKYGHRTHNWFEAIVNKLGGEESADAFLRDELVVQKPIRHWTTASDGTIRFQLTSLGLTGQQWIERLESKGHRLSRCAKDFLNSPDFVSCEKGKVYNLAVLPGKLFSDGERTTENIRTDGDRRNMIHGKDLPTEIGALIRLNFTNKEIEQMGQNWLTTMREPVKDSDGVPRLLCAHRLGGESWLHAPWAKPDYRWHRLSGFVFVAPQD